MPLVRYFGVVGSALLMLLLAVNWLLPESVPEPYREAFHQDQFN
jgi:hypothetical protein